MALLALTTACTSGGVMYMSLNAVQNKQDVDDNNIVIPDIDNDSNDEETPLSKILNSLLNSKELYNGKVSLGLKPVGSETVNLNLNNLDVDLSNLNTSVVNLSSDVQVQYGKSSNDSKSLNRLDQTISLRIENNEACYTSFKNRNFMFNIPQNLSDLMEIIKATGLLVNNAAESTSELNLSSLLEKVQDIANDIKASDSKVNASDSSLVDIDISLPDIEIKNTKISNLNLTLTATSDTYSLKSVSTLGDGILILNREDENHAYEKSMSLVLNGSFLLREASGYKTLTKEDIKNGNYKSITNANTSVFNTIRDVIGNDADVALSVSVDKSVTSNDNTTTLKQTHFDVNGLMQTDVKNKKYSLALDHLSDKNDTSSTLNSLSMKYMSGNIYLQLNELLKAKLTSQDISNVFSAITDATGSSLIEVFSSQVNTTLGTLDIDALKDGDMTQIQGLLDCENTYFDYDATIHSFILSIDGEYLGLTSSPVVVKVACDDDDSVSKKGIKEITIEGLNFKSSDSTSITTTTVSVSLKPQTSSEIETVKDEEYQDMKTTVSLFTSLANVLKTKQFYCDYTLSYKDKINDGTIDNYQMLSATGSLGADMTSVTKKETLFNSFSTGTYFFKMNATAGATCHNLNMTYQTVNENHNLYFGYDTIYKVNEEEKNNTVFRNYLENAQLGEMKTILNGKTKTNVSSSLDDSSKILGLLSTSEEFQNLIENIKKGSLIGLEDYVSITTGTIQEGDKDIDCLYLVIKANKMFKTDSLLGKNIGDISIILKNEDLSFKNITISTAISSSQEFSFALNFKDYQDLTLSSDILKTYTKIDDATSITKAFYNLSNNISKYGVKVEALYKNDPVLDDEGNVSEYGTALSINGSAYWDMTNKDEPKLSGELSLEHPFVEIDSSLSVKKTKATQNLKFKYQNVTDDNGIKDGLLTADYNSNMHVALHSSTITDMVSTISSTSETNLLNKLLSTASDVSSSMPIKDVISQSTPSLLLSYPYIQKVELDSSLNTITLKVDKRLFDISSEGDSVVITIQYEDQNESALTKISVDLSKENKKVALASISLVQYDETLLPNVLEYNDENKGKFVSLDGFKTLSKMMIDTTENNYFHFTGYLNLDFTLFNGESQTPINLDALCFDINIDCSLYIDDDGKVNTYLALRLGDKDITQAGYYVTEYAITTKSISETEKADYVYINNTRTDAFVDSSDNIDYRISTDSYRVTKNEFESNILYYLVSEGLGIDDRIAGRTIMANIYHTLNEKKNDTTTSSSENVSSLTDGLSINLNSDFSSIFSVYDENQNVSSFLYNQEKQKFTFNFNLNNLFSINVGDTSLVSFDDVYLKLYHMTKNNVDGTTSTPFYAMQMNCDLNVLNDLLHVSLKAGIKMATGSQNVVDMSYVNQDEEGQTYLDDKMARYNTLISLIDNNVTGDYQVSPVVKRKVTYDFSKMELSTFINDYDLNDNGNHYTSTILVADYVETTSPLIYYYHN